jgi:sugar phosphate isomerase/epimerase
MTTRRGFLQVMAGGAAILALGAKRHTSSTFGVQLWSLRDQLQKDLPGTLAQIAAMGFRDVETAGFYGLSAADFAAAARKAGLACRSGHFPYERWRDDAAGVVRDAKTMGASLVICPWITHEGAFTRESCLGAAKVFTAAARTAKAEGLRFGYHLHGYEFVPAAEGTLFELLVAETPADLVGFQVDVVWALAGGNNPAALIEKLGRRAISTHLKDLSRDIKFTPPTSDLPVTGNVVLGTGVIDFPAILAASKKAGIELHFLEDEGPDSVQHLPQDLKYIQRLVGQRS